ncbi:hypothetical protein [Streptomyces umbrinus]|uniref:hypothetical protein n=1 Tax=Streptomyces umbrinus TaxID=67370 RepID=UPI0033F2BD33
MSTPNYPLAVALASIGWGNGETARRINAHAQQQGHHGIAVDRSRVGRWIRHGEKPRPPVPALLAELLTEHLGKLYTPEALGLAPGRPSSSWTRPSTRHSWRSPQLPTCRSRTTSAPCSGLSSLHTRR